MSVSYLQSIQHAAGACNGFLQVTPSGRILENAGFLMGWRVHSAPLQSRGQGAEVLQQPCPWLTKEKKKKEKKKDLDTSPTPICPLFPYYTQLLTSLSI